ncbi:MAG: DUF975 family protein [Candidatus Ornithomonoglobus sp.]
MYSSAFYKMEARKRLMGNYGPAFVGTLIYMIPSYLVYLIGYLTGQFTGFNTAITYFLNIIFEIFVFNIFMVGYMRFLLNIKPADGTEEKRFDFNDVLSGYTNGFKNTLKTMFLRDLYLLLWGLIAIIPMVLYIGIIAYLSVTTDTISNIYNMMLQLIDSPSPDMLNNISSYIIENCAYLPVMSFIAMIATFVCMVPVIYKSYEYSAIPMILAENPDMGTKDIFKRSFNIMHGFRWKYFCIQLSFILYMFLTAIVFTVSLSVPVYYFAQALLMPYLWMTLLAFYTQRRDVILYNISVYGNN